MVRLDVAPKLTESPGGAPLVFICGRKASRSLYFFSPAMISTELSLICPPFYLFASQRPFEHKRRDVGMSNDAFKCMQISSNSMCRCFCIKLNWITFCFVSFCFVLPSILPFSSQRSSMVNKENILSKLDKTCFYGFGWLFFFFEWTEFSFCWLNFYIWLVTAFLKPP